MGATFLEYTGSHEYSLIPFPESVSEADDLNI